MNNGFNSTFKSKIIYIFRINDREHENLLKIGDATLLAEVFTEENLVKSAKKRIDEYTSTAGIKYELLFVTLAKDNKNEGFRDYKVHEILNRSGIKKHYFDTEKKQNEWFEVDLETAKKAVKAVIDGKSSLLQNEITRYNNPIVFRPEQQSAITQTLEQFKKSDRMLWNAKMRFGKTLTALQVAKISKFRKTLIMTHRPVVDKGWYDDFNKIFYDMPEFKYSSKNNGEKLSNVLKNDENKLVYFASIQDLRGSKITGGNFDKNDDVFSINWDYVVIDEAHEGTQTELAKTVITEIKKNNSENATKILELSGTPFNLLSDYTENEIYTWDYVMEQEAKLNWSLNNYGDSNPYEELPRMNIYTYDLNKLIVGYEDILDKAFNFREFFKVWTGKIELDGKEIPHSNLIGTFIHENDVISFLNLISKKDEYSNYPFSTDIYRDYFRHTLWMVPGVKEAKALSTLLKSHPVFSLFKIINVAGNGDEEYANDSLEKVTKAQGKNPEDTRTITISCGRLTTGVSIKPWTAVLMLYGSYNTSASNYLQTIFRVQTPANIGGKIKEECFVFDFAPDRTLKMLAEAGQLSVKAGSVGSKVQMGNFLNYCPVIAVSGSSMKEYDVDTMLQQLKKSFAQKVVANGFDDIKIYNDNLLKLDGLELEKFTELQKIIGSSKQTKKSDEIIISDLGFTNEEYEQLEKIKNKKQKDLTEEDKKLIEEHKEKNRQKQTAISILRGISIRIPLLIYGANISENEDINCNNFVNIIDNDSWAEFMPKGVTKDMFQDFSKYYDQDVFIEAGRQIRNAAKYADTLYPDERIKKIADIFRTFKNPDKETVLTPWKTVNMHMGDILGGYNFYDLDEINNEQYIITLEDPRFIHNGEITLDLLSNTKSKILEINSKTGLYPLYITYSIYKQRTLNIDDNKLSNELAKELWNKTVEENIFVLCKTEMAKAITLRTLLGYNGSNYNIISEPNILNDIKTNIEDFASKIKTGSTWKRGDEEMKFNAIVGNPPYQLMDDGHGASSTPVYHYFIELSKKLDPTYISMITPSRWFAGGKGLDSFRSNMLANKNIRVIHDYISGNECFPGVEIKGGVSYFLINNKEEGTCKINTHIGNKISKMDRYLLEEDSDVFIRYNEGVSILKKVLSTKSISFSSIVSSRKPFGLATNYTSFSPNMSNNSNVKLYANKQIGYMDSTKIIKGSEYIDKWKIFVPKAIGSGDTKSDWIKPIIGRPRTACTETYILIGPFNSEVETLNCAVYTQTKFFHYLLGLKKITQDATAKVYHFIPLQNFSNESDINWKASIMEIENQLYKKYNFSLEEIKCINDSIDSQVNNNL
ncbi:MAG: Eco57I restriction-modification methylase domain-containing protein [Mycoplasmatota bacterium]